MKKGLALVLATSLLASPLSVMAGDMHANEDKEEQAEARFEAEVSSFLFFLYIMAWFADAAD